ncbi:MAG: error-prone DNA polymerase [Propionibacteriaceae bacterium]|nr:error-prone DNA polymerase [Propionibacteriaceae bacterium]
MTPVTGSVGRSSGGSNSLTPGPSTPVGPNSSTPNSLTPVVSSPSGSSAPVVPLITPVAAAPSSTPCGARSSPVLDLSQPVPYAELHAHSSFSFLDGASDPAELAQEANRLGLHALALTDHDGLYGIVRLAEAAEATGLKTVFGAELSLDLPTPQNGNPDPVGRHLLVLARGIEGYRRLAHAITHAQLAGAQKGRPIYDLEELSAQADGHWVVLSGCRKSAVRRALAEDGSAAASRELGRLVDLFGQVYVELTEQGDPLDAARHDALAALAREHGLPIIATGNVHYATPANHPLAQTVAAIRANRCLDETDGWLPAGNTGFLRSGAEQAARFFRYPGAVAATVELADELAFSLRRAKPDLPDLGVPPGHTPMSWLRKLVWDGVPKRYPDLDQAGRARIERELSVIEAKDFPGYFLIVAGIVAEARRRGILCQGRGSAANSAVCYLLDITAVDSIGYNLPFERFLSSLRDEEPDIDVDFDSDRREEIIQWVFQTYGRERAAQVCTIIQYRPKNAIRDVAKALGHSTGQQDAYSRQVRGGDGSSIPPKVLELAEQLLKAPRHLGIHSGGMVLTRRPVGEVVPIEHARMPGRTVIQWDKDDAAWMGLVKFDLLGLGILAALQHCFTMIEQATGETWELATIPKEEPGVYDMLCRADSVGVFQVESRAQMGLLPRLRPRCFYDLAIQIALIRPGPIQGGAVHPFVRRKLGEEPVTYAHPKLEPVLARTLGIPVFQEQLMQMAMAVGECSGEDADLLRRAMGSKRGVERIETLRQKLYDGMARNGLSDRAADQIYAQIQAFANFGFAESHSLAFSLLVYVSAWLKLHYPAAFLAGLLRAQPMGFYSPATLVADARRHGVEVRRPDLAASGVDAGLEPDGMVPGAGGEGRLHHSSGGRDTCLARHQPPVGDFDPDSPDESASHRRDEGFVVRLGLAGVRGIGRALATKIVTEREAHGPYASMEDLTYRVGLEARQLEALATAGAFDCLGVKRRHALWKAGSVAQYQPGTLPGIADQSGAGVNARPNPITTRPGRVTADLAEVSTAGRPGDPAAARSDESTAVRLDAPSTGVQLPLFEEPTAYETLADDLWATGVSPADHLLAHLRPRLNQSGVLTCAQMKIAEAGRRVTVAGLVIHRQHPSTAGGVTFLDLEDETGILNIVCSQGFWRRNHQVLLGSNGLVIRGLLERVDKGATSLLADAVDALPVAVAHSSRDFR